MENKNDSHEDVISKMFEVINKHRSEKNKKNEISENEITEKVNETMRLTNEIIERVEKKFPGDEEKMSQILESINSAIKFRPNDGLWKDSEGNIHVNNQFCLAGYHFIITPDGERVGLSRS